MIGTVAHDDGRPPQVSLSAGPWPEWSAIWDSRRSARDPRTRAVHPGSDDRRSLLARDPQPSPGPVRKEIHEASIGPATGQHRTRVADRASSGGWPRGAHPERHNRRRWVRLEAGGRAVAAFSTGGGESAPRRPSGTPRSWGGLVASNSSSQARELRVQSPRRPHPARPAAAGPRQWNGRRPSITARDQVSGPVGG